MLPLLPSVLFSKMTSFFKVSNRQFFFQRILFLAFIAHAFLFSCMVLFSMISKKEDRYTILMHQAGATYVLMPLQKKIDQKNMMGGHKNSSVSKKSQVLNYEDYLQKKRSAKGKKNSAHSSKKSSAVLKKHEKSSMKLASKSKASAMVASFDKKNKNQKNKKQKKNKIKLMSQKQEQPKKEQELEREIEQPKMNSVPVEKTLTQEQEFQEKQINEISSIQSDEALLDDVIFVGYEQFDECLISSKIQHAVGQNWTPPIGIEDATSCELKIKVSMQGLADKIEIMKSSGILVYDTSAKAALSQVDFPQEVYGKTIRIVLGN